jgi:hypothetical protein
MRGEHAGRREDKSSDRQLVREEKNPAPVDAERRHIGDQKTKGVDPPAPLMDGSAFGPQQNLHAGGEGEEACDEMHPTEREEVEVHGPALAGAGRRAEAIAARVRRSFRVTIIRNTAYCSNNAASFAPIAPKEMNQPQTLMSDCAASTRLTAPRRPSARPSQSLRQ